MLGSPSSAINSLPKGISLGKVVGNCMTSYDSTSIKSMDRTSADPEQRMIEPETIKRQTCYGEIHRLAPQVKISKTPGQWRDPLVSVRGSAKPVWEA